VKPRGHDEERQARLALQKAKVPRQPQQDAQGDDDRRRRLHLHRSPVDAWGPRGTAAEVADYARVLEALREGRVSGAELLKIPARVHYSEPRTRSERLVPEPAIWTGAQTLHAAGPIKLTAEQILEATDLVRSGTPWRVVARHFGVAENTLRRYVARIGRQHG
jgi:hypothetical protein